MNGKRSILIESLWYFLGGAIVLTVAVRHGIPLLHEQWGVRPLLGWWLTSGVIMVALFVAAILAARQKTGAGSLREILLSLTLRPMNRTDALWALGGLLGVVALTALLVVAFQRVLSMNLLSQDSYASFLRMEKLRPDEYWLFLAWVPYFFFNITGEELLWRGYLLPRQVQALGRSAWVFNGLLWAIFHLGIGWRLAILLLPIEFILPYVVQKRQNAWLGILIHGLYNGSGFVMVALGAVS